MKKILLITLIIMLTIPMRANAFSFENKTLSGTSKKESVTAKVPIKEKIEKTLNENINEALLTDTEVQNAFISMVTIISDNNEVQTIKENLKKANTIKDRTEKENALNKIYNEYSATLNNNRVEIVEHLLLLSDTEKEKLKENIDIVTNASQKYLEITKRNIQLAQTIIKEATAKDDRIVLLNNINKLSEKFAQNTKTATSLSRQIKILASLSGIKF